jgi:Concanavalin A-like lectin/glucanases superfamily/Immunoglobulin I-set domain
MKSKSLCFLTFAIAGLLAGALPAQGDITTGLVGYWPLNDGTGSSNVVDYSGNNDLGALTNFADATYNNMWTATTDPANGNSFALSFNPGGHAGSTGFGTNTYVIVPDSSSLDTPSTTMQWTLSAWVYLTVPPASEPPNAGIICKGLQNAEAYDIYMSGTNFGTRFNNAADGGNETVNSTNVLAANTWYNVTITVHVPRISGSLAEALVYVNGSLVSSTNSNTYTTVYASSQPLTIGCRANAAGLQTNAFIGYIDQARVYNRMLSPSDVFQLYTNNASQLPPAITQQPVSATVNQGAAFTNSVSAVSTSSLFYQWYTNGVAEGNATNSSLIINPVTPLWNGINYYAIVTNLNGAATSSVAHLTVETTIPTFISQLPITYSNLLGTNLFVLYSEANPAFSVSTLSATPVTYFWFTNGLPVGGALATNLTLTNVQTGSFNCFCVASNTGGFTATSAVWSASVLVDPPNSSSGLAPYPQQVLALNPIGYWRMNDTNVDGPDNNQGDNGYICHDYVSGNNGIYTNVYLGNVAGGTGYNPAADPSDNSAFFGDDADNGSDAGDQDANSIYGINFGSPVNTSKAFTVEAWVSGYSQTAGAGIVALGWGTNGAQFDLDCGAANNAYRFLFTDGSGNTHAVNSSVLPTTTVLAGPWYHLVGVVDEINSHTVTFYINGLPVGSTVVTNGSGVLASASAMSIGAKMSTSTSSFDEQFTGFINDVAVFNYALSSNQVANEFAGAGNTPPFFTQPPPTNITIIVGTSLTIPVTAFGTPANTYTWYDPNGHVLTTGSTNGTSLNATFSTNSVPLGWNGGQLELSVNNSYGQTNVYVNFTVESSPIITNNLPLQADIAQGQSYTYSIGAIGASPLHYQWLIGASPILNQTNATYTLTGSSAGAFNYSVVVTNFLGSATSLVSTLTVLPIPTNAYSANILALNPVGYWPMHEIEPAAPGDIETNYGSLGIFGAGYYVDWVSLTGISHNFPGALANDPDTAVYFPYNGASNSGDTTNCLLIPHNSPAATLNPPFTVECWFWPTNANPGDIWGQDGYEGLNAGNYGGGSGNVCGIRVYWNSRKFTVYTYDNSSALNQPANSTTFNLGQWHHVVVTCDANTNFIEYVDGSSQQTNAAVGLYSPDYWSPMTLATSRGFTRNAPGIIDEFAVYPTNLAASDISTHYSDASGGGAGVYVSDVMNDHPTIYLRMDSPAYTPPPATQLPVLVNFGSSGINGVYSPATAPGIASGPIHANGVPINGLISTNVPLLNGVGSFADAGYATAYNPLGSNTFSVTAMFRGNPCDGRFQDIVGHSDLSWRIAMNSNGHLQSTFGPNSGAVANSSGVYNDGNWHQVVAVYQPASNPAVTGTNLLYVDGVLDTNVTGFNTNGISTGTNQDVMIGAAPDYTNNPGGLGRQFDGQICDVAIFNSALTSSQVQALYSTEGGVGPSTLLQPLVLTAPYGAGTSTHFTLTTLGTTPLAYQWYFNNTSSNYNGAVQLSDNSTNITGSATAQLTITNVATTDAGWYYALVTNNYGSTTSQIAILNVVSSVNAAPTNVVATVTNGVLYLTWPSDHTGWQLQALTNAANVGIRTNVPIGNNWVNCNPSTGTNQVAIPINLTNGTVFYRLTY